MLLAHRLAAALREEAEKRGMKIEVKLRNIQVNDNLRGCSGHVTNTDTGSCVYIDTEGLTGRTDRITHECMYRFAENDNDYSSNGFILGYNRWCDEKKLAGNVVHLLKTAPTEYLKKRRISDENFQNREWLYRD